MRKKSSVRFESENVRQVAEAAFAAADLVREDVFFFEGNTHLPMEQHSAVAQWGADGKLALWSSTQTPHYVHRLLAKILDVPQAHIRVIAAPVGGGFGGKLDPFAHEIAACKLSQVTGRPVKITLTREEVFYVHRGRHPVLMWIKTGFARDGAITGMHFRSWLDGGAYFYVCGDAKAMAKDVRAALVRAFADVKSLTPEAAEQAVVTLEREKRYLQDTY